MHIHSQYLHPTTSGHAQAGQIYLATQGYHHGCEPYLWQGDDGTTYAIHPGDWPGSPQPFASGADASTYGTNQAANAQCAPIYSMNPYFPYHAYYKHAVTPAFVQYLPQMPQLYAPPAFAAAVSESKWFVPDSYHPAQSVQHPTSCADGLKAPKPKRPDEGVPNIIVEDEIPDIVVEDCDSGDAQSPKAGSATPATNSSDGAYLHPHWHERNASPSDGSLASTASTDSPVTSPSEGPRLLHPHIHAIKSISCHCTPRVPLLKDLSSSPTSPLASLTAHPSSPTASATPSASLSSTAAGTSTASTAPDVSTAPALTARPVSSPPVMAAVVVHMFPFSPLVPKVSLGSLRMSAGSFETQLPLGFVPGVLSPWVVDGRGLSLQPSPAEGATSLAAGDSKLTPNNESLPPYSPAPSMVSVTSHWDGERLVFVNQDDERLVGDPWGHEDAVRRWLQELDEFCRTERCATKARWPTLAEVSKVKGDEAAKANDARTNKVDHAEAVQLYDHTDLLARIPWPILHGPDSHGATNTDQTHRLDLARSITPLSVNLFFRAARQVLLDNHTASPATLNDHAASCDTPDDGAWCALLRKSHRAFRRAREVLEERLKEVGEMVGSEEGKQVHWKDEVEDAKVDSADDDEVVVYTIGNDMRDESAEDGRDEEAQHAKGQKLEDAKCQRLKDTLRALNIVLKTLDVLRRLDGY